MITVIIFGNFCKGLPAQIILLVSMVKPWTFREEEEENYSKRSKRNGRDLEIVPHFTHPSEVGTTH